jgi:hypothetical protein
MMNVLRIWLVSMVFACISVQAWELKFEENDDQKSMSGGFIGVELNDLYLYTVTASYDPYIPFWEIHRVDASTGKLISKIKFNNELDGYQHINGNIIIKLEDQSIHVYNAELKLVKKAQENGSKLSRGFRAVGNYIFSLGSFDDGIQLKMYDINTLRVVKAFSASETALDSEFFEVDGVLYFSGWSWGNTGNFHVTAIDTLTGATKWVVKDQKITHYIGSGFKKISYHFGKKSIAIPHLTKKISLVFDVNNGDYLGDIFDDSPRSNYLNVYPEFSRDLQTRRALHFCSSWDSFCSVRRVLEQSSPFGIKGKTDVIFDMKGVYSNSKT